MHRCLSHPHYTTSGGGRCRICGQNVLDLFGNIDHLMIDHPVEFAYFSSEAHQLNSRVGVAQSVVYWLQEACQPLAEPQIPFFTHQDIIIRMRLRADSLALEQNGRIEEPLLNETFEYIIPPTTSREMLEEMIGMGISESIDRGMSVKEFLCRHSSSAIKSLLGKRKIDVPPPPCSSPKMANDQQRLRESPPSDCLDPGNAAETSSALVEETPKPLLQMKNMNNGRLAILLSMLTTFGSPEDEHMHTRVMVEAERIASRIIDLPHCLPDDDARVLHAVRNAAGAVQKAVLRDEKRLLTEPLPHELWMKAIQLAAILQPFYPDPSPSATEVTSIDKLSRALTVLLGTGDAELLQYLEEMLEVLQQHLQQHGGRDRAQLAVHVVHMHEEVMQLRSKIAHPPDPCESKLDEGFAPGPSSVAVEHTAGAPAYGNADEKGTIKEQKCDRHQSSSSAAPAAVEQPTTLATLLDNSLTQAHETIKEEKQSQPSCSRTTTASSAAVVEPAAAPVLFDNSLEDVKGVITDESQASTSGRPESPFFITNEELPASPNETDGRMIPAPYVPYSKAVKLYEEHKELWRGYPETRSCKFGCVDNVSQTALVSHYRRCHYDIYFLAVHRSWESEQRRWLAVRFGDESISKTRKDNARICLLCGTSRFFNDRAQLAKHLKEEHPEFLTDLRTEFLELFDGEIKKDPIVRILLEHVD